MDFDEILQKDNRFRYMLLSRMQSDCAYFLGNGNHSENCLWGGNVKDHISYMKALWESFSEHEKPEWLTYEQIQNFEKRMLPAKQNLDEKIQDTKTVPHSSHTYEKNIEIIER